MTQSAHSGVDDSTMPSSEQIPWKRLIAEAAAIVLSILLAFGIDAWWDLRAQEEDARGYLEAIQTELKENREIIEYDLQSLGSWVLDSRIFLEDVVSPEATPSKEQVRQMVWETGPEQTTPLLRAAIDDLISSGGLQAIKSAEIRRAIAQYVRTLERDASELEDVRDNFREYILQYHLQYGSFTEFDWEEYAEVDETQVTFALDIKAFAANRDYANLLIVRILNFSNLRDTHREVLAQIDRVLTLVDGSM